MKADGGHTEIITLSSVIRLVVYGQATPNATPRSLVNVAVKSYFSLAKTKSDASAEQPGRTTLVERDLAEGRLIKPFGHVQSCELACYLVHTKEREQHAPMQAFKEWLLEEAGSG
jgi:hypothetical protein